MYDHNYRLFPSSITVSWELSMDNQAAFLEHDAQHKLLVPAGFTNISTPIQELPTEILSLIFKFSAEGDTILDVLRLEHVCSGWRHLISNSPLLWLTVPLVIDMCALPLLDLFLERTGGHPFSVNVNLDRLQANHTASPFRTTSQRWRSLTVDSEFNSHALEFYFPCLEQSLHALEELSLQIFLRVPHIGNMPFALKPQFNNCPRLRKMSLGIYANGRYNEPIHFPTAFPWHQLTSLSLTVFLSPANLFGILRECSQLKELMLKIIRRGDDEVQDTEDWMALAKSEIITFLNLIKLAVPESDDVLLAIHCPVLEELEMWDPSTSKSPMITFLSVSKPPLRSLLVEITEKMPRLSLPYLDHLVLRFSHPLVVDDFVRKHRVTASPSQGSWIHTKEITLRIFATIDEFFDNTLEWGDAVLDLISMYREASEPILEMLTLVASNSYSLTKECHLPSREAIYSSTFYKELVRRCPQGLQITFEVVRL
ncbi:hypothetical protein CYLTODRAFT_454029 [Cylindrobasidium torrendii FP15055 ss-10]|uniref:F-box domain-containing protein n=1 Tax=Cylindrobasidium torrendii FP15055 ss-10 TaxID=1314674 RepID=A0A0D7BE80_9AGAR|nr:hypothetical protein CYLTODRAFT_454029 [Cylindrobasidium torrendii FP15055 ss-10]